ncbi:MAG: hypothetical protein ACXAD7_08575 [Candidatus Kariarchaeaceae archaeon]|jgi:phosphomannomutase
MVVVRIELENIDTLISDRIVGTFTELIPEFSATLGAAVGTWLKNKGTIAIGRDFRTDSRMMKRAFTSGLMSTGVSALDFHAVPTPLLQFYVRRFGANAGVMFTSGHYEGDKTGIRIFNETGAELTADQLKNIRQLLASRKVRRVPPKGMRDISEAVGAVDVYLAAMKNLVNRELISSQRFKVVIDCALGPTTIVLPEMLSQMNVKVIAINSLYPTHVPENLPNTQSLISLAKTVKANEADLGFAFDVEGSRVLICDENGFIRTTDKITSGLAAYNMKRSKGTIIVSESSTGSLESIAKSYGENYTIHRIRDQPGTIAAAIRSKQGIFGASDTGSYWAPSFTVDSDGIYTSLQILELLANEDNTLSNYLQTLPQVPAAHRELVVANASDPEFFEKLELFHEYDPEVQFKYTVDTLSGVKVVFENGWVNVSINSRDPQILQLVCEAEPFSDVKQLMDTVQDRMMDISQTIQPNTD